MDEDELIGRRALQMQLTVLGFTAFAMVYAFAVMLIVANNWGGFERRDRYPWVSWVSVGFLALQIAAIRVYPSKGTEVAVKQVADGIWQPRFSRTVGHKSFPTDTTKLLSIGHQELFAYLAPLEGAAFLGCMAFMWDAQAIVLLVIDTAVVLMLIRFPSHRRVGDWLTRQREKLAELRQNRNLLKHD